MPQCSSTTTRMVRPDVNKTNEYNSLVCETILPVYRKMLFRLKGKYELMLYVLEWNDSLPADSRNAEGGETAQLTYGCSLADARDAQPDSQQSIQIGNS